MRTEETISATNSVFTKIIIWFSALAVVLLSASSIWTYYTLNQLIQVTQERREIALGKGLALAIGDLIVTRNYAQLEVDLRYIMSNESVHSVVATDLNGDVYAALERKPDSTQTTANFSIRKILPPVSMSDEYLIQKVGDRSVLWYRVNPGIPLGWIRMESYLNLDDAFLENLRLNIMMSIAILFIGLFGVSIALFYRAKKKTLSTEHQLLQHNEILHDVAYTDALTQLPNRLSLNSLMRDAMLASSERGCLLAVCFLDLDGFKEVNDQYGHQCGDKLLIAAARRMKKVIRESDCVVRLAGDEFVLLLGGIQQEDDLEISINRILSALSSSFMIDGENVTISASIGVSVFPTDGSLANDLVVQADSAMYQAKRKGKNTWVRFSHI
ncbi:GGDEF domain-containing protein [Zwartia sp.]|uniref:GGDEF domain-containing protein n=1 Tax=Zwartia sp. TaxID=2978004 RepID=UPI002721CD38|nr:GGDEF domain-containing protein [Zwartia sp.]MDO9025561.1 GGDEF domain-containing protein [Zwartia sp.]